MSLKKFLFLITLVFNFFYSNAFTDSTSKWRVGVASGQYSAKLGFPSASPFRLGYQIFTSYGLNKNTKHQLRQSIHLASFRHRFFQTVIQFYTEFQYEWHFYKHFYITPLAIGGGYVASFLDMTSLKWNGASYEKAPAELRNNFLVSLGTSIGYKLPPILYNRPLYFALAYRLQVQGIIIKNTVPIIAYSSLQLSISAPF
jgi:hypothetical protein